MIKKIVCAALTTALLISSAVGVMAADYSTTTKYSGTEEIEVTSTVTGVAVGDTLTYLAHEDTDASGTMEDSEVVYIDQITADATTESFTYVTKKAAINATVLYGGKTAAGAAMTVSNNTVIPGLITVVDATGAKIAEGSASDKGEAYVKVAFTGAAAAYSSVKKDGVEVEGWFSAADGLWIPSAALTADETTLVATAAEENISVTTYDVKEYEGSILVLGNATGVTTGYGAKISSAEDFSANVSNADSVEFEALGKNTAGDFLIELDYGDEVPAGTYYAKAYAGSLEGKVESVTVVVEETPEA